MPFSTTNLAVWLAAAQDTLPELPSPNEVLAAQLIEGQLERRPDTATVDGVLDALRDGRTELEIRSALCASYERFVATAAPAGVSSEPVRRLMAVAETENLGIDMDTVVECIAAYRVATGRDPDPVGFRAYCGRRTSESLGVALMDMLGSGEAVRHFAPNAPPSLTEALPLVHAIAASVAAATAADAALGRIHRTQDGVDELRHRMDRIERTLHQLTDMILLRLDAGGPA
jgi:hypothetical protein